MDTLADEKPGRWLRTIVVKGLMTVLALFAALAIFLFLYQDRLIYYPRRYLGDAPGTAWAELRSVTSSGQQVAFYARGGNQKIDDQFQPSRLWLVFSGNAATAGEWEGFVQHFPDPNAAFLLIDYPGYGFSQGKPSPETIRAAADGAYAQLAQKLGAETLARIPKGLIGHSLGAAAGLDFIARQRWSPDRLVLIAPFTTMTEMARRVVGWPLCLLLSHRFDNVARLHEILARSPKPSVTILHGAADEVIPISIGRRLAADFPEARFQELPGEMHNTIFETSRAKVYAAMAQ